MMNFRNSNNRNSSALNNIRNKNGRRPLGNDIGPMINAAQVGGFGILGHAPSMPTGMGGGGGGMNNMGGGGGGMNNMGGGGGMNNMGGGGGMNNMGGGGGSGGMNNMGGGRGGGMNNNMANMNNMGNFGGMMPQQATNMGMGGMVGMGSGMMMQQQHQQQQQQQHHQQQHHQQQHQRQNLGVQQQQAMRETQLALVNSLLKGSMMGSGGRNRNPQGGGNAAAAAAAAAAAGMGFGMLGSHGQLPSLLDIKTSGLKRRAGSESMSGGVKKMKKDNTERSSRGKERIIRPNDRRRPQGGNPTTTTTTTKKRDPQYSQGRKDQPSNRRQRDTSAKKKLEDDDDDEEEEDDDEMYDPAEPTDDEIQSTEHSNGGLTVTIDGNKRSVTEDGMRDSGSDSEKTDSSERKSQYYCHACMVECYNNKNFKNHMRGTKHRSRMDDLANLHQQKATQLFVRLKAEEHLRNIEKRGTEPMKKHYCSVCELNLSIPYNKHRQTREHQLRVLEVYGNNKGSSNQQINDRKDWPRCSLCDQIFKSPRKYVHHLSSARHKERKGQKTEEYTEVPEYEENKAYGQNYIIPVSGYFCKLCHKFYNNENAAKNTHCQSKAHFEKFEKIIREKIEAKKNAEAGESESEVKEDETREFDEDEMEVNKDSRLEEENCEADDDDDDDDDDDEVYTMQSEETMPANMEEDLDKTLVPEEDEDGQNEDRDEESDHEERKDDEEEDDDEILLADKNSSSTIIEKSTMDDASREDTEEEDDQPQKQQPEEEKQPQQQIVDKSEKQSSGSPSEGEEEKEKEQTSKGRNRSRGRGRGRGRGKK